MFSKKNQPKVSIVFVNWNGKKYTTDLIESLKKIKYKNYEIIVVDNNSSDGSQKELKKKYRKEIILIENKENLGLAEGTNVGIRKGLENNSKYILVMNNDMKVDHNFLDILVERMEKNQQVAVSTPVIYYIDPEDKIWCAGCKYTIKSFKPLKQGDIDIGQLKEGYVDACDCVLMMRSKAIKELGELDKSFFIIHEFTEWCLRATNKGFKCLFVPESKVWHKVRASLEGNKKEDEISTYYNIKNWLLTIRKNKNFFYFMGILILESTILAIIRFCRWRKFSLIKTYYIAIWHALINKTPMKLYSKGD
jgi:GT2 family glycosyltransferase